MNDCCSSSKADSPQLKNMPCPSHGSQCKEVKYKTVIQHIKSPWELDVKDRRYFFCDDADCDVVYFSDEGLVIHKSDLRTTIGIKDKSENALICYCFGVSRQDAMMDARLKNFVTTQTKQGLCACETRNPSGLCCLKNFPA